MTDEQARIALRAIHGIAKNYEAALYPRSLLEHIGRMVANLVASKPLSTMPKFVRIGNEVMNVANISSFTKCDETHSKAVSVEYHSISRGGPSTVRGEDARALWEILCSGSLCISSSDATEAGLENSERV